MHHDNDNTREISDTERNRHGNEVPMPEQKTGDVQSPPWEGPHLSDGMTEDETPDHPQSDRA